VIAARVAGGIAAKVLIAWAILAPIAHYSDAVDLTAPAAPQIMEDSPAWDCRTMGNRICGPDVTPAGYESDSGAYVGGFN
jgi:hypothetical protein